MIEIPASHLVDIATSSGGLIAQNIFASIISEGDCSDYLPLITSISMVLPDFVQQANDFYVQNDIGDYKRMLEEFLY